MNPRKVVIKFLNGGILKGDVTGFTPETGRIKVSTKKGKEAIDLTLLKAVFFLREGDRRSSKDELLKVGGKRIRVSFADGEEITGYTYGLHPLGIGFYLFPMNETDSNEKIFVVKGNTIKIQTLLDKE